ncbi:MAG: nucleotidyltransferase family protein [Candidatus Methanospirareceae archaeon]
MTRAVILAGGFGMRLRPLTATVPKAMIPLVNRPVIDYILDYLVGYGLNDIVITTNYLREQTIEYLTRRRADLKIAYPAEPSPLGTAGSVKNAAISERMLVIQGDNITEIDLRKLLRFHDEHGGLVTIALLPVSDPCLFGIAKLDATGKILAFKEKPAQGACFSNLANTGCTSWSQRRSGMYLLVVRSIFPRTSSRGSSRRAKFTGVSLRASGPM